MQASELYNLITTKLPKASAAHYNAVGASIDGRKFYFSTPGDEYYTIVEDTVSTITPGIVIHYITNTHHYTLNNAWTDTTIDMHNQFRTIMKMSNIVIPTCEAHELVELGGETWVYNAWKKPFDNCKSFQETLLTTDADNPTVLNNLCIHTTSTLNALSNSPMGSKVWPKDWYPCPTILGHYGNDNSEWYWVSPLNYENRYTVDATQYATGKFQIMANLRNRYTLNMHLHVNRDFYISYINNLNSEVFNIDLIQGALNG